MRVTGYANLSIRVWSEWYDLLKKAAQKLGISPPAYVRDKLTPIMARDLGLKEVPDFPELVRGRPGLVKQAAEAAGMTPKEFARMALEDASRRVLKRVEEAPQSEPRRASVGSVQVYKRRPSNRPPQS